MILLVPLVVSAWFGPLGPLLVAAYAACLAALGLALLIGFARSERWTWPLRLVAGVLAALVAAPVGSTLLALPLTLNGHRVKPRAAELAAPGFALSGLVAFGGVVLLTGQVARRGNRREAARGEA